MTEEELVAIERAYDLASQGVEVWGAIRHTPALVAEVRRLQSELREMTSRALGHAYTASMAEGGEEITRQELARERVDNAQLRADLAGLESNCRSSWATVEHLSADNAELRAALRGLQEAVHRRSVIERLRESDINAVCDALAAASASLAALDEGGRG